MLFRGSAAYLRASGVGLEFVLMLGTDSKMGLPAQLNMLRLFPMSPGDACRLGPGSLASTSAGPRNIQCFPEFPETTRRVEGECWPTAFSSSSCKSCPRRCNDDKVLSTSRSQTSRARFEHLLSWDFFLGPWIHGRSHMLHVNDSGLARLIDISSVEPWTFSTFVRDASIQLFHVVAVVDDGRCRQASSSFVAEHSSSFDRAMVPPSSRATMPVRVWLAWLLISRKSNSIPFHLPLTFCMDDDCAWPPISGPAA